MAKLDSLKRLTIRLSVALFLGFLIINPGDSSRVATANGFFTVNSTTNSDFRDDYLTLREAIRVANGSLFGPFTDAEKAQLSGCTFSGSSNDWLITAGCGAGIPDTIAFAGDYTINLTTALEELTDDGTIIGAFVGQDVKINGNGQGNVFRISGSDIAIDNLKIYGAADGSSTIWVIGSAKRIEIANSVIGDDDATSGGCGQNAGAVSGIKITSNATVDPGEAVTWIYGNTIECNEGSPGDGIIVVGTDDVVVGADPAGNAGAGEKNNIGWNARNGIRLETNAEDNTIRNNYIDHNGNSGVYITDSDSNLVYGNTIEYNSNTGLELRAGSQFNRIGCPAGGPSDHTYRNQIRLNSREGIYIGDADTKLNWVLCNWIGLTSLGIDAAGNGLNGVAIAGGASNNSIGFTTADGNVISGNGGDGIQIVNSGTNGNHVYGNRIGTNVNGDAAVPNGLSGVAIFSSASNNTIGDKSLSAAGNVIAGNTRSGVFIGDPGTTGNTVDGNYIGLSTARAIPNGRAGMTIRNADGNTIGSSDATTPQLIQHNTLAGIYVEDANNTFINTHNSIKDNGTAGVAVVGDAAANDIWPGEVHSNGGLPIDLNNDGHTPNDPSDGDSGPNNLLNYPEITSASGSNVTGTACPGCFVRIYDAVDDPTALGGGGVYLFSVIADFSGTWSADLSTYGLTGADITLTAVESFNTSEMSPLSTGWRVYLPLVLKTESKNENPKTVSFTVNASRVDNRPGAPGANTVGCGPGRHLC